MKEEYLHHVFKLKMFGTDFLTQNKQSIQIIDFGEHNTNAGPDFLDAKIIYDNKIWVGAIEFHVNASDWYLHKHQNDPAYGNVIAHFVFNNDKQVTINKFILPTVELKSKINQKHYLKYNKLLTTQSKIPCQNQIKNIPVKTIEEQKTYSINNRLWNKAIQIITDIEKFNGNRNKAYLFAIARVFGGTVNQIPFEQTVLRLNSSWYAKLNYDPFKIEALIFGLSGITPTQTNDQYVKNLIAEFKYQKQMFGINQIPKFGWKYSRMRPPNFPDIRLAQFAAFSQILNSTSYLLNENWSVSQFKKKHNIHLNPFWNKHYRLTKSTTQKTTNTLSSNMLDLILINAVIPFIYAVGFLEGNQDYKKRAIVLLKQIKAENNSIIKEWKSIGLSVKTAFDSQSLLELKKQGCNRKKCLFCTVGKRLLKRCV